MVCPKCKSENIDIQVFQEDKGSRTRSRTKSKYKEKGHGFLWWVCIGWWWWIVDLALWIFFFLPRLVIALCKKRKYVGEENTVSHTKNKIGYRSVCVCKDCGHSWPA